MLATFAVYYPSTDYDFMWDDFHYLGNNTHIQNLSWSNIQWMFTTFDVANWHPLTWLSFAVNYTWQGSLNPWGFHLTNIILHGFNSIGVFFLTILLLNIAGHGLQNAIIRPFDKSKFFAAFIAALLFSIHPQHVESVAWISERKDVLCQFFLLFTVFFYIFYTKATATRRYWFLATIVFFILALMSKPMAVTLPVILFLLDIYPLRRTYLLKPLDAQILTISWNQILIEKVPFILLTIASIVLTLFAQTKAIISIEQFGLFFRVINAINSVFLYISKFFLPIALSPLYPFPEYLIHNPNWLKISILIIGFILVTTVSIYYWQQKKKHYLLIIWLFYLVTLSPVIGIIQVGIQSAADRYAYLPTLPFYILVGSGIAYLYYMPRNKFVTIIKFCIISGIAIVFSTLFNISHNQLQVWKHGLVLWNYVIKINPASSFAQHNLAAHYFHYQNYKKSLEHVQLAMLHGYPWRREQGFLGEILIRLDRPDEALEAYKNALEVDPSLRNVRDDCIRYNMGWIYTKKSLFAEARKVFETIPVNSSEFAKTQALSIQIAMLDKASIASPELEKMKLLQTATLSATNLEQAKLDNLLAKQGYSFCANQQKFTP
ncbi:MAG TPA: hypothetical protein PKY50_03230 [Candidatus Competibacter sp.]|nr:hypothetical protein [Candidatus Competibacter sp.]